MKPVNRLVVLLLLAIMALALPIATAQDITDAPTEVIEGTATLIATEPAVTPEPTLVVEPTVAPPVDEEPIPPSRINWNEIIPWLVIGGVAVLLGFLYVFKSALAASAAQIPLPAWEIAVAGGDRGLLQYGTYVKGTPGTTDDAQFEELSQAWEDFKEEVAEERELQRRQMKLEVTRQLAEAVEASALAPPEPAPAAAPV